jgi:P-type Cu+ transporter
VILPERGGAAAGVRICLHPQIVRSAPGPCPICGMALEPRVAAGVEENAELDDMTRSFQVGVLLTAPRARR